VSALMSAESGADHPDLSPDPLLESLVEYGPSAGADPPDVPVPVPAPVTVPVSGALSVPPMPARAPYPRPRLGLLGGVAALALLAVMVAFWAGRPAPAGPPATGPLRIETQPVGVFRDGYAPAELTLELVPGTTAAPLRFVMVPLPPALVAQAGALPAP